MPKERRERGARTERVQKCQQGIAHAPILPSVLAGILFEKGKGQHILRNPLIISSIVEKVNNNFFLIFLSFFFTL